MCSIFVSVYMTTISDSSAAEEKELQAVEVLFNLATTISVSSAAEENKLQAAEGLLNWAQSVSVMDLI